MHKIGKEIAEGKVGSLKHVTLLPIQMLGPICTKLYLLASRKKVDSRKDAGSLKGLKINSKLPQINRFADNISKVLTHSYLFPA